MSGVMPVPILSRLLTLPQETLNNIYKFALQDAVAYDGLVELVRDGRPWKTGVYYYATDDNDGSLSRINPSSPSPIAIALTAVNKQAKAETLRNFWEIVSAKLVFSNTVLLTKMAPAFSQSLREVTILKRFQTGAYCDVGTFKKQGHGGNSSCLFKSIECLKNCPQLRAINIHLSIFNCQWQFSIAATLAPARLILGTQARIQVAVKHCVHCDSAEDAFGISEHPFTGVDATDNPRYFGPLHQISEKEYWEWTSDAGSEEWKIERFQIQHNGREKRVTLQEILAEYRANKGQFGVQEARQRLEDMGRILQQCPCFICSLPCVTLPVDLRVSRHWWCRGCSNHLTCGRIKCILAHKDRWNIIPPDALSFTPPLPVQSIHQDSIRELRLNGSCPTWNCRLVRPHHPQIRYSLRANRASPTPWEGVLGPNPPEIPFEIVHDMFGTPFTVYASNQRRILVNKLEEWQEESEDEAAQLEELDENRELGIFEDKHWASSGDRKGLRHRHIVDWLRGIPS